MIMVDYPSPDFRIKKNQNRSYIFDPLRKTWLLLTEEEWVRQNFVAYLIHKLHYPAALIALEKEISLHLLKKRFDILIYNKSHAPWLIVECKAPEVPLNEKVLQQALRYHITVPADYIILTNGAQTMGWQKVENSLELLTALPDFPG